MKILQTAKTKIGNQKFTIDDDGFMTINAVILKEGIFDYGSKEIDPQSQTNEIIKVYIPADQFTAESLETASGKDVIHSEDHEWRDVNNALSDGVTVGQIKGIPTVKDGKIYAEFLIKDNDTINRIKNKELVEVSAGYMADFYQEDGEYEGNPYSHKQSNLRFNHALLLPVGEGRCGSEVKIVNKKEKKKMSKTLRVRIGNSEGKELDKSVEFENEADADKAEALVEEVKNISATDVENAMEEIKNLKEELEVKNSELADKTSMVEEFKNKLEEALSPEAQEELAEEIIEQRQSEEEVVETEFENEEEKEEVKAEMKAMNRKDRMVHLAKKILNKKGMEADNISEDRLIGSFLAMAADARSKTMNKKTMSVPAAKVMDSKKVGNASMSNAHDRMFAPMRKK